MSDKRPDHAQLNSTTHSGVARMLARTLAHYGLDAREVFSECGLTSIDSMSQDDRVVSVAMQRVWRRAVQDTGDESFGLTFARQLHPAALHGLGFAWAASDTLRDALGRLVRYYRLIATAGAVVLEDGDDEVRLTYQVPGPRGAAAPASLDAALALFLQLCRLTRDDAFAPSQVQLQRAAPQDEGPFQSFFRCPVVFDAPDNSLFFDPADMDQPLPMANPELARANDQVIIDYLNRQADTDIVNRVRAALIESLPAGTPAQDDVARSLNVSGRTLQRRLAEQSLTFKGLLETVRQELAVQYLATRARSVSEVAYLLGYSEPGNFARSFRRWTGRTPVQFQADL